MILSHCAQCVTYTPHNYNDECETCLRKRAPKNPYAPPTYPTTPNGDRPWGMR
jgi:hypothetical protein